MLKIQYASDLHLEFPANREYLKENPIQPAGDILVLCGDILTLNQIDFHNEFFDFLSKNFKFTYWIPGNHEYYRYDIAKKSGTFKDAIRENVFLVNNVAVQHENVKLILSTMWSEIKPQNRQYVEYGMADFHLIKNNGKPFSADHYNQFHRQSIEFIKKELKNTPKIIKTAVFTHHCPTFINYPPQWLGSSLNDGFAVELSQLIENSNINYWCYGHHHTNTAEFTVGKTKMICNQLGYVQQNEHYSFDRKKYFIL